MAATVGVARAPLASSRTPAKDLEYLIGEVVEIALRALSPGVNDPFTSVTALHWLGAATASFAARDLDNGPLGRTSSASRVLVLADDFGHFVRRGFGCMRAAAAASPIAGAVFIEALVGAAARAYGERRQVLLTELRTFAAQVELALEGPSLEEVRQRANVAAARIGSSGAM